MDYGGGPELQRQPAQKQVENAARTNSVESARQIWCYLNPLGAPRYKGNRTPGEGQRRDYGNAGGRFSGAKHYPDPARKGLTMWFSEDGKLDDGSGRPTFGRCDCPPC